MRFLRSGLRGLGYGLSAWTVYGTIETVLSLGTQFWRHPESAIMAWQWRSFVILFAVYVFTGVVAGSISGLALALVDRDNIPGNYQIAAMLTITCACGLYETARFSHLGYPYRVIAIAAVLTPAFFTGLTSKRWRDRVMFLSGPVTVSFLLLGPPWINSVYNIQTTRLLGWGIVLAATLLFSVCAHRLRRGRPATLIHQLAMAGMILILFVVGSVFGRAKPSFTAEPPGVAAEIGKPNVVLITMDTVRADHLSIFGYSRNTAPNLQEFSKIATVYQNAIATSDFTLPTHGSIFTGLYASWHGAQVDKSLGRIPYRPLTPDAQTLAELLALHSYSTAAVVANYGFLSPAFGLMRGFETLDWTRPVYLQTLGLGSLALKVANRLSASTLLITAPASPIDVMPRRAGDINRSALGLLRQASHRKRPFFLFVNYMDAHFPYASVPPFDKTLPGSRPIDRLEINQGNRMLQPAEQRSLISQYDGAIATEDEAIAELLDELRKRGVYDNTLIIVTSDHGEAFGERGFLDHGLGTVYQDQVHVPLIIKYPGQHAGARSESLVSQVDLLPTVLDTAGIQVEIRLQGTSLRSPTSPGSRPIFIEAQDGVWKLGNSTLMGIRRSVLEGSMKYIAWTNGPPELYDLASDPNEQHDLYRADDPKPKAFERVLTDWAATIPARKSTPQKSDYETIQRLKSLGYVQ